MQTYEATGDALGGKNVDDAFEKFLEEVFGKVVVDYLRMDQTGQWLKLMCFFELAKKCLKNKPDDELNVEVPHGIHEAVEDFTGRSRSFCTCLQLPQGCQDQHFGRIGTL